MWRKEKDGGRWTYHLVPDVLPSFVFPLSLSFSLSLFLSFSLSLSIPPRAVGRVIFPRFHPRVPNFTVAYRVLFLSLSLSLTSS